LNLHTVFTTKELLPSNTVPHLNTLVHNLTATSRYLAAVYLTFVHTDR